MVTRLKIAKGLGSKERRRSVMNKMLFVGGVDHNPALLVAVAEDVVESSVQVVHLSKNKVVLVTYPQKSRCLT